MPCRRCISRNLDYFRRDDKGLVFSRKPVDVGLIAGLY